MWGVSMERSGWNVSPNRTRVTVRFRPVREKKSIKDQRGWLVLNAFRRQVIVASGPMVQAFPLSGSPVRPNDIAQEPEFLPRSSVRNGNSGDMTRTAQGSTGPGDAAEVAAQEQHGHRDHPQPEHQVERQPDVASPADAAECGPRSACDG